MNSDKTEATRLPVVALGCSAGGLRALESFFRTLPPDVPFAVVVVQHLDPSHESLLPELLRKVTAMPLAAVSEAGQVALEPGHAYIIPPGLEMTVEGGRLRLCEPSEPRGHRMLIDVFLRSLAEQVGDRATAIILSGSGADGSLGLRAVKEQGGLVVVQDPATAEYPAMPQNAIATGLADMILPPEEMASSVLAYQSNRPLEEGRDAPLGENVAGDSQLARIAAIIRTRCGQDFRHYKAGTFARRVARRMAINGIVAMDAYIDLLEEHSGEVETLLQDVLIGVTQFFRDREVFETLSREVLTPYFARAASEGRTLRIWVPGCSTGEEAYTIAMLLEELRRPGTARVPYKIFATDIDDRAIEKAREGLYPESIVQDVPESYLRRYFIHDPEKGIYRVKFALRDHIVFAPHNIFQDPPYSKLDLVSCRNLLIYLDADSQQRALEAFSYALQPRGFLLLGSAERLGPAEGWFEAVDGRSRLYRRREGAAASRQLPGLEPRGLGDAPPAVLALAPRPRGNTTQALVEQRLLNDSARTCMAVDTQGDLLYVHGSAGKYLDARTGRARNNILINARKGLELPLAAAFRRLRKGENRVALQGLRIQTDGDLRHADLEIERVAIDGSDQETILVVLTEIREPSELVAGADPDPATMDPAYGANLEQELRATREHLQSIIEELETTNEELKSTNEEFQSANEELQSTNEELKTSKEELQSVNEELVSVNAELENKLRLLTEANSDIQHLLESTHAGVIFLDENLCLRRYTEAARQIVDLIPVDVGRPISHFAANLDGVDLHAFASRVLETRSPQECEVSLKGAAVATHLLRGQPYRTVEGESGGVVLTFIDIGVLSSDRMRAEEQFAANKRELERRVALRTAELEQARRDAEAASRAKTDFLSKMSHELRTPLNGIIGFAELARERVEDPELKQWLATVLRSGLHLNRLVDDILDISRIEREAIALAPKPVALETLVRTVCELVEPDARAQGLDFELKLDPRLSGTTLLLDANRVSQVLLNLLTNAIKFTRGGAVTLAAECLERLPGKLRVRFTVTDSGPGIAKADQERIFAMFEQADNSLTRESGGSGLGLAISRRLAEAMEGSLTVQSESGAGSVFTFEVDFPLVAPPATGTGSLETLVSDLERRCRGWWALVADDDPVAQELARLLLEALGIRVEVAPDGAECLAMARRRAYDLVLMDWQMPQLDGIAATRKLLELPGYGETPVLAITAHAFEEDREACLAAGMCGYIAKPLDAERLYRQLHDCLSGAG